MLSAGSARQPHENVTHHPAAASTFFCANGLLLRACNVSMIARVKLFDAGFRPKHRTIHNSPVLDVEYRRLLRAAVGMVGPPGNTSWEDAQNIRGRNICGNHPMKNWVGNLWQVIESWHRHEGISIALNTSSGIEGFRSCSKVVCDIC